MKRFEHHPSGSQPAQVLPAEPPPASPTSRDSATMEAVLLGVDGARLARRPRPLASAPGDVVVQVQAAGLCRTDLYVANGTLPARPGVVLGHEASGLVHALGPGPGSLPIGTLVGLDPRVPCGSCSGCEIAATPERCLRPGRLGIERDGVFAEYVVVPAACLYPVAASVSAMRAAYLEPVAAAMGALGAGLQPGDRGVIAGEGRIAELTARILEYAGFPRPAIVPARALPAEVAPRSLDFLVDAGLPDDATLGSMMSTLRKGGTLVLKSRTAQPRSFVPADWVEAEITVAARAYGSFERAARALADPELALEDLFGPARPLADFLDVFADGLRTEEIKQFFRTSTEARRRD